MRLGRSLTLTDIDTYITNYISNYELTEEQIAEMIANASGAIGCLSYLLGIDSNKVPVTCLTLTYQVIPNAIWTALIWEIEKIDNLNSWAVGAPTLIKPVYSGLYDLFITALWTDNIVGYRHIITVGHITPELQLNLSGLAILAGILPVSGVVSIEGNSGIEVWVYQSSGDVLMLNYASLLLHRRAFLPYLG